MKPEALLKLYKAMKLEVYPEPPALDRKRELEASTERTRFGQPVARGWVDCGGGTVTFSSFTPTASKDDRFYRTELDALMAARNAYAVEAATSLAKLDRQIAKLLAGTTPKAAENDYAKVFEELRDAGLTPTGRTAKEPEPQELPKPEARLTGFAERMKAAREAKKQKGYD